LRQSLQDAADISKDGMGPRAGGAAGLSAQRRFRRRKDFNALA